MELTKVDSLHALAQEVLRWATYRRSELRLADLDLKAVFQEDSVAWLAEIGEHEVITASPEAALLALVTFFRERTEQDLRELTHHSVRMTSPERIREFGYSFVEEDPEIRRRCLSCVRQGCFDACLDLEDPKATQDHCGLLADVIGPIGEMKLEEHDDYLDVRSCLQCGQTFGTDPEDPSRRCSSCDHEHGFGPCQCPEELRAEPATTRS